MRRWCHVLFSLLLMLLLFYFSIWYNNVNMISNLISDDWECNEHGILPKQLKSQIKCILDCISFHPDWEAPVHFIFSSVTLQKCTMHTHRDEHNLRNLPTKTVFLHLFHSYFNNLLLFLRFLSRVFRWCCLLGHLKLKWAFTMHTSRAPITIAMAASDFKNLCKSWFLLSFSFLLCIRFVIVCSTLLFDVCVLLQHLAFMLFKQMKRRHISVFSCKRICFSYIHIVNICIHFVVI